MEKNYPSILEALNPWAAVDHYKVCHRQMYPNGLTKVYSNFTPRSAKHLKAGPNYDNKVVVVGLTGFSKWYLIEHWNTNFFKLPKEEVVSRYKNRYGNSLGPDAVADISHIEALHDLGHLPIRIKGIKEGSRVNIKVPVFTVTNTDERFAWIVNYLETVFSSDSWKVMTAATICYEYRRIGEKYAELTGSSKEFIKFQFHNFADRGMAGFIDAATTGFGHLASFAGTDSVGAIEYAAAFYNADVTKELVGVSVPASEHSVACSNILDIEERVHAEGFKGDAARIESERRFLKRMITEIYPNGIVSYVADSYDFWGVVSDIVPSLKETILTRNGKLVIRPDSGDPVLICAGYSKEEILEVDSLENAFDIGEDGTYICFADTKYKVILVNGVYFDRLAEIISENVVHGAISCLWNTFGGTVNEKGYKELCPNIGLIYGDSISLERAEEILKRLSEKGFASSNVVFGAGSYSMGYHSRDTLGFAMKATYIEIGEKTIEVHKDPKTDPGKKSAKGLLRVDKVGDDFVLTDCVSWEEESGGELKVVFENGKIVNDTSLAEIRETLLGVL